MAASSPARSSRAREAASRRLIFARSPGFLGISYDATTVHSWPSHSQLTSFVTELDAVKLVPIRPMRRRMLVVDASTSPKNRTLPSPPGPHPQSRRHFSAWPHRFRQILPYNLPQLACDEDQLGTPKQPSDAQRRASHLTGRGGIRSYAASHASTDAPLSQSSPTPDLPRRHPRNFVYALKCWIGRANLFASSRKRRTSSPAQTVVPIANPTQIPMAPRLVFKLSR